MMQFNAKVNVLRITKVDDTMMGSTEVPVVLHSNLPCRINWSRGAERIMFDKNTYYRDAKLFCRVVDITVKDRISYNGTVYQIADVSNVDNKNRFLVLDIKLIE